MWPLVGRDEELALAREALADGSAGGVVIAGAAGVGKTRLAAELASSAGVVEWVRATRSAAGIPLGAFAALLPAGPGTAGVELLARVREGLVERAAGRRMVLCVDDAHLLDDASAALVHQLAAARETFAVVTVREGEPVPDAVRALWKDELCALVELPALGRDDVAALLETAAGAPVDGRSLAALWERSRGNPLFLRELARSGAIEGGVWRWRGVGGGRLADVVGVHVGELGAGERAALEHLAVGGSLEAALLEQEALAALETRELAVRRMEGRRRIADVAHPLYGEVVRAGLAGARVEAIERELADAVDRAGARRREDLPRLAAWRLATGGGDRELFARAAERAIAASDPAGAERFARAAGDRLLLGRALAGSGRAEEADRLLTALVAEAGSDDGRATAAIAVARNRLWGLGRADDALAALDVEVGEPAIRELLAGHRVRLLAAAARPREALAAARPLLEDERADEAARLHAALGAAESLAWSGRSGETLALIDEWLPAARRHRGELPYLEVVLSGLRGVTLRLAGHLEEATAIAEAGYEAALRRRSGQPWAVEAYMLGLTWLARGRVRTAIRCCREGAAVLRDVDAVGMLAVALAGLVQAAAQAGERELAREGLAELERTRTGHVAFEPELGLARAWAAAAEGELTRARSLARETADAAAARGQDAYAVLALHALCRLGEPDPTALATLCGLSEGSVPSQSRHKVDGPFAVAAADHAAALEAGDGAALDAVAERFAAMGASLVAAEAAEAAAAAHGEAGLESSARRAAARAARLLAECEQARPPTLPGDPIARELTPREREIALLAATGLSNREIGERLVVSVRTVDNHLQRAYGKLGITSRQELARLI